jgi:hypothetical protein
MYTLGRVWVDAVAWPGIRKVGALVCHGVCQRLKTACGAKRYDALSLGFGELEICATLGMLKLALCTCVCERVRVCVCVYI